MKTKTINHTDLSIEQIQVRPRVGRIQNNWRQREVTLYESEVPGKLYMIGKNFNQELTIVTLEDEGMNERIARNYWAHGNKTLVRD